jgi:hypothetical protein
MSIGAWVVRLVGVHGTNILGQPASIQWLDIPTTDGVVGFIESLIVTLHVCVV